MPLKFPANMNISPAWLAETLKGPEQIVNGYGGRKVAQKRYQVENRQYLLRVVFEDKGDSLLVITAYLTSQIERYREEKK